MLHCTMLRPLWSRHTRSGLDRSPARGCLCKKHSRGDVLQLFGCLLQLQLGVSELQGRDTVGVW